MNVLDLVARPFVRTPVRSERGLTLDDVLAMWSSDQLPLMVQQTIRPTQEVVESGFAGYVSGAYFRNSIVFACLALRARLFSEVRFAFQQLRNGRPGNLFGTPLLRLLENPEPGVTTGDMLMMAILDADLAGDAFMALSAGRLRRLRPDWTVVVYGSKRNLGTWDPDAEVIGYGYYPGGVNSGSEVIPFLPGDVAHFAPTRDPLARNRGVSLITAGIREVMADNAATSHKLSFFQNGATVNMVVTFPPEMDITAAKEWKDLFEEGHRGSLNAYRTLYLGGGPKADAVGSTMEQMEFSGLQGKAETRIAALTGMHPVVAALSEGLSGSSLNAGNFAQAARLVGDATLRPLWRNIAAAFQTIVPPPPGSRLWYDERDVAFLRDDIKAKAEVMEKDAGAIRQLVDGGFVPASVVDAITTGDYTQLVHSGNLSVQLQPPGTPPPVRALREFWPLGEDAIEEGTELPAEHPIVRRFPNLFAKVEQRTDIIVTRSQVLAKRAELMAARQPAGIDSLARALAVSRSTIQRRLAEV
jgi:phage portal protein BeeE